MRRLRVLIEHSALDSEYARDKLGDQARWSTTEHLLATIADLMQVANYQFASVNSKRSNQPNKPEPLPRPGQQSKRDRYRTKLSEREIARRLVQMQRAKG